MAIDSRSESQDDADLTGDASAARSWSGYNTKLGSSLVLAGFGLSRTIPLHFLGSDAER